MQVIAFLDERSVIPELRATTIEGVLDELATALAVGAPNIGQQRILQALATREATAPTAMEKGVAIPHGRLAGLPSIVASFGMSHAGIDFKARDGGTSHFFFALLAPDASAGMHLKALAKVSRLLKSDALRASLMQAGSASEIHRLIAEEDARTAM